MTNDRELAAVGRLRYRVYVEELGRHEPHADHARRLVVEPSDACAYLFAAFDGERVVGTLRGSIAAECDLGAWVALLGLRRFGAFFPHAVSVTTKAIVDPAHRRTRLLAQLVDAAYDCGIARGVRFDAIACKTAQLPLFARLGYRRLQPDLEHPDYGCVHPHVLVLHDEGHLRAVGSPLLRRPGRDPEDASVAFARGALAGLAAPVSGAGRRPQEATVRVS